MQKIFPLIKITLLITISYSKVYMEKFQNQIAIISYDEENNIISMEFKMKSSISDFIAIHEKFLEEFYKLSCNKYLVNLKKISVVSMEGHDWVVNNLFNNMLNHIIDKNLFHAQIIPSSDIFAKFVAENVKMKAEKQGDKRLVIKSFYSDTEAKEWLRAQ